LVHQQASCDETACLQVGQQYFCSGSTLEALNPRQDSNEYSTAIGRQTSMSQKVTRRALLHTGLITGVSLRAVGAQQALPQPITRGQPPRHDAYEEALRRHGGELGGSKATR
jgi:hypothetical protein